ncbi:beta 1-4 rhamnosyltransferase Cps2T [Limosilactobacillus vaginalis]|uniref:beta 1-4 rhamnosyltransferase Cps2T n=1 Tax=Limosilactobacillus vaginalis TaxID=1633 RepID=UPI0022DEF4FB|nr:DUF1972 domain-containing protein [Limosilactobacillus vaginalis]
MNNVFIGCKGIPANYGGFETFTDNLVTRKKADSIQYYVACISNDKNKQDEFDYNGSLCKNIFVPNIGPAKAILYDTKSLKWALEMIDKRALKHGYVYILGCTIGPLINLFKEKFKDRGFKVLLNPDGHEWKRDKWPYPVKVYLKLSEKSMVKSADLTICDSLSIKSYIENDYSQFNPKTTYISYGSDIVDPKLNLKSEKVRTYFSSKQIHENEYYLVVGRFVPENNYETIIREFMLSNSRRDLVIITNYKGNKFFDKLKKETAFDKDKRIKFVGTVYDAELLKYIRKNAFAYIHGHSVGGTNPSLLEALGLTKLNLLYNVGFNNEVAGNSALYWDKSDTSLSKLINRVDNFNDEKRNDFFEKGKEVVTKRYTWDSIINKYEELFTDNAIS